jgi:hypothetical protein
VTETRDDDVVDPLVRVGPPRAGKDPDRRPARRLRAARRRCHHLSVTAADDGAAALREQAADLLGALLARDAAADHAHLDRHRAILRADLPSDELALPVKK